MVDTALESAWAVQAQVRDLPSRVVVYLLLAGALFAEIGYTQVWARMTAGLRGIAVDRPGSSALAQAACDRAAARRDVARGERPLVVRVIDADIEVAPHGGPRRTERYRPQAEFCSSQWATSAPPAGLRAGSTASSMSSTIWSAPAG